MKRLFFLLSITLLLSACGGQDQAAKDSAATEIADTMIAAMVQTINAASPTPSLTLSPTPENYHCDSQANVCSVYTSTPTLTPGPSPTPTLSDKYFHGSYSYDVPYTSQEGLRHNGALINTGCTAACVQMVLDFWHEYDNSYPTISAQELIDLNAKQHLFSPISGLNIRNAEDELNNLAYYMGIRTNSDQQDLLDALERYGPLLVLTKLNWTPFGANHMAVVTAFDKGSNTISLLDPQVTGGIVELDYDNFDGIWGLNYSDNDAIILQRSFFFIVPESELRPEHELFISERDNPNRQ